MPKNRKLLSVGTPTTLASLRLMLDAINTDTPETCIVKHRDGQLIVEEPHPTFENIADDDDGAT